MFNWEQFHKNPDSKVHGANMGPTWVLSAADGPHVGPMNLAIREMLMNIVRNMFSEIILLQLIPYLQKPIR